MFTILTLLQATQSSGATRYVQEASDAATSSGQYTMTATMIVSGLVVSVFMLFLKRSVDELDKHISGHGERISQTEKDIIEVKAKLDNNIVQIKQDISEIKARSEKQDERWLEVIKYMSKKPLEDHPHEDNRHH